MLGMVGMSSSAQDARTSIMLTARSLEKDLEQAFDVGPSGHITKPFRTRELAMRVRAALRSVSP